MSSKVRRLSDGRIFSNPRGVAIFMNRPITKAVYYCCQGYILAVEGERYEWYDDGIDRGKPSITESYWLHRGKWTATSSPWNQHNVIREIIFKRSRIIKAWLDVVEHPDNWRTSTELSLELSALYENIDKTEHFPWTFSPNLISRHLHAYNRLYEKMFGMHEKMISFPLYKGRIFKFVKEDSDPEFDILVDEIANTERKNAKPVYCLTTKTWYQSMREAERMTGVPYYRIFHCCEEDMPGYVNDKSEIMEFRYATEVECE